MPPLHKVLAGGPDEPLGRRIVATSTLQTGRCIFQETPYACVLTSDTLHLRCDCCLALPSDNDQPLSRCSGCRSAYYLDRNHQKEAWRSGHNQECPVLRAAAKGPLVPTAIRLALRVILKAYKTGELDLITAEHDTHTNPEGEIPAPCGFSGVLSLLSHWEDSPDAAKITFAQQGAWAWHLVQQGCPDIASKITPRHIALLIARFSCNNHTICDDELRPFGLGVYPLTAMANHSCTPNCVHTFGKQGRIDLRQV